MEPEIGRPADGRSSTPTPCSGPHVSWLLVGVGLALIAPMAAILGPDTWFSVVTPASVEVALASVPARDRFRADRDDTSQGETIQAEPAATCARGHREAP